MNIEHDKERRMNFEADINGQTNPAYLWAIFAASIAALLVMLVLKV